ncbi:ran-binding protein 9 isoform X2 [Bemisia tabaci]|uniref:ran-binding protein 9 isoform X2 n=1 Tax=Bemisia tabaci TaxID=7038 RepID=UPI0008F9AC8B|nr:PREDICTED: ran-binding protein 9 isoform X2 [Bemisia tabaci]
MRSSEMAAAPNGRTSSVNNVRTDSEQVVDRLKLLYPMVNEEETPLPRSWSPKDKYNYIGLSQSNLRVHYKGHGKNHKDAASVRATHPIPAACGLYYFEVKIVSKGRDGYMGIGLSAQGVNMNRLPGWDKHSYGYHGDDGHSFCSSGTGQPYGPTFTTGDVIGCGVNLVDNTCFYTKNGHNLGVAFTDLPPNLYPTVGLQTPGEVVDANFGQSPFVFDIEDMIKQLQTRVRQTIYNYPVPDTYGTWQTVLQKMVSTYLVHHGYCATAEAFARGSGQPFEEEITSIKNRQKILKLVLAGRMGEAIETTSRLYPGLLESNRNLMFLLKCRQFVEMVNGSDSEVCSLPRCTKSGSNYHSPNSTPPRITSPPIPTSVIQSTKALNGNSNNRNHCDSVEEMNAVNKSMMNGDQMMDGGGGGKKVEDVDMIIPPPIEKNSSNGHANGYQNGDTVHENGNSDEQASDMMEVDTPNAGNGVNSCKKQLCGGSKPAIERMLEFGRELYNMSLQLRQEQGRNETNKKMLQDAFSLLAYANPWNSPVGWQLDPIQRETVCAALNSAILESSSLPRRPPLEVDVCHARQLVALMSRSELGSCAFASVDHLLRQS